jgi:tetratricopeptide (TPR) repeat protein
MSQQKYSKAYEAYQQAVYRDGRNPTFWCSIGVLYYQINQYRDALDAYSRAIRLNPYISEVWYDLGTLVSRNVPRPRIHPVLTYRSTSLATTRLPMPWTLINGHSISTRPTCTSRHDCSSCATMGSLRECQINRMHLCLRTCIPSNTKLQVLGLLQGSNGACRQGQIQCSTAPLQVQMALHPIGLDGWQIYPTLRNHLLSPPIYMINANHFDRRQGR